MQLSKQVAQCQVVCLSAMISRYKGAQAENLPAAEQPARTVAVPSPLGMIPLKAYIVPTRVEPMAIQSARR